MAEETDASIPRKRVRTGCLTCRGRRRKCDEGKPECSNCKSKNLTCRYGVNVTFVQSKFQQFTGAEPAFAAGSFTGPGPQSTAPSQRRHSSPDDMFDVEENEDLMQPEPELPIEGHEHGLGQPLLSTLVQPLSYRGDSSSNSPKPRNDTGVQYEVRVDSSINIRRDQYETELLTFYRYHVAPVLDLGLGSLPFGIQTVLDSMSLEEVYHAVLALAGSRRAALLPDLRPVDEATSVACAHFANQAIANSQHTTATAHVLLMYRALYTAPVELWSSMSSEVVQIARYTHFQTEDWNLLARMHLSTILTTTGGNVVGELLPPPGQKPHGQSEPIHQVWQALRILEQNLSYLNSDVQQLGAMANWLLRWQDVQGWYRGRSEDIRQLFELADAEISDFNIQDEFGFPCM